MRSSRKISLSRITTTSSTKSLPRRKTLLSRKPRMQIIMRSLLKTLRRMLRQMKSQRLRKRQKSPKTKKKRNKSLKRT